MRYFNNIQDKSIFYKEPEDFCFSSEKAVLSMALGATIYMAATRETLMKDVLNTSSCTVVICLEDSVATSLVEKAEINLKDFFYEIQKSIHINNDSHSYSYNFKSYKY